MPKIKFPVELFIALRYLKSGKKGLFSLLTSLIAVGGTMLGTAALIITLAVMSGFQTDIRNKILGIQPHIIVMNNSGYYIEDVKDSEEKIKQNKEVSGTSPFIYRQAIIRSVDSSATLGLLIKAADLKKEQEITGLLDKAVDLNENFDGTLKNREIILGNELAKNLTLAAGDEVLLMFPSNFASVPKMYKFIVAAIIHSGMYDYDSSLGFIDIEAARDMFSLRDYASGISVRAVNFNKVENLAAQLQKDLGGSFLVRPWTELNRNLFAALKLEKTMMFLILGLIILVAAFNIISNLLLLSAQKFKEIGILSAIGYSRFQIAKIFFYEGFIIGALGAVLGILFGISVSLLLKYFDFFELPQGIYYVEKLPVAVLPQDIVLVSLCAFIITALAGLYPAYQVSKLDPLEAMRNG
ncbi:MAG: ABC transporter permease [Elusimicrobiota bacterium]|jgi:lipoprotein-releasing system permease protein|nr:ABC transporter permease [Elusimicrobiota bacterium]